MLTDTHSQSQNCANGAQKHTLSSPPLCFQGTPVAIFKCALCSRECCNHIFCCTFSHVSCQNKVAEKCEQQHRANCALDSCQDVLTHGGCITPVHHPPHRRCLTVRKSKHWNILCFRPQQLGDKEKNYLMDWNKTQHRWRRTYWLLGQMLNSFSLLLTIRDKAFFFSLHCIMHDSLWVKSGLQG